MPENPIHPGRNSTNTSEVPPETNLVQSALKSCLIYARFSSVLMPAAPHSSPCASPAAFCCRAGWCCPKPSPQPGAGRSSLLPLGRVQREMPESCHLQPVLLPQVSFSAENVTTAWLGTALSSFGQAFSEITLPSRKPSLFEQQGDGSYICPSSTVFHCHVCKDAFVHSKSKQSQVHLSNNSLACIRH